MKIKNTYDIIKKIKTNEVNSMNDLKDTKIIEKKTVVFSELYVFINMLPKELKDKISVKFIEKINNNAKMEYCEQVKDSVSHFKVSRETEIIIGMMYRDYFCSNEERKKLYEEEKKELLNNKRELISKENYNVENLFQNKYTKNNNYKNIEQCINSGNDIDNDFNKKIQNDNEKLLVVNNRWYFKLINKIKIFFNKIFCERK